MNENWINGKIKIGIYQSEMLIIVEDLVWFDLFSTFFFQIPGYLPWIVAYVVFILSLKWWFGEYIKKIDSWFSQLSKYFYRIDFFSIFYMTVI